MITRTVLAGNGDQYASLTYWSVHHYPTAGAVFFGARLAVGPGTLEIGNGELSVLLDMTAAGEPTDRSSDPDASLSFSAPVISASKRLEGIEAGQRLDVYMTSLDARHRLFPWEAADQVMHTKRELHGPGPYPEHTLWGKWINGYRAVAAARAAAKEARK